jgi:hypothetical protein
MCTLDEFYRELQEREGLKHLRLVSAWAKNDTAKISKKTKHAFKAATLKNAVVRIKRGSTNQSIGNQIAKFVVNKLNSGLHKFLIEDCSGAGYPDKILKNVSTGRIFPFEVKATSQWNPSDSNRRVLTSSSNKLREKFRAPINHLLITILYEKSSGRYRVEGIRLDFLEPTTRVSVRLEASVNHRILTAGTHHSKTIT